MNINKEQKMMKRSFIEIDKDSHFPIQNLPFGIFRTTKKSPRVGVAIGDYILDMSEASSLGYFNHIADLEKGTFEKSSLNTFMKQGKNVWSAVRKTLQHILDENSPELRDNEQLLSQLLVSRDDATMMIPVEIKDYTDFYASKEHATNVGAMFRGKENALNPNWLSLPVGYHGRSSSIFVSGHEVNRPMGQILDSTSNQPKLTRTQKLDFELETAFFVGTENKIGHPIPISDTENHIFGMVIMNDWSARDIQKWEYVPLGPFLGKNFHTSISPWVVTLEALEPFRTNGPTQNPIPLSYLKLPAASAFDINLEVFIKSESCEVFTPICLTNFKNLYWSMSQQLAHHSINGCNMRTGDLLGSGTISGNDEHSVGCLLEKTLDGQKAFKLLSGLERTYLKDGDTVKMTGYAQGDGYRVGFGDLINKISG
jgi:fumarylacetoacetase